MELTKQTASLIARLDELNRRSTEPAPTIRARESGGSIYFLYEKIRNAAEYREQHLFLRGAIQRFLNRKLRFFRKRADIGHELIIELIRTRYLKNDAVPQSVAEEVSRLIDDYLSLHLLASDRPGASRDKLFDWTLELASAQIERLIVPRQPEELIVSFTYESFRHYEDVGGIRDYDEATYTMALFAAIHRTLLKSDLAVIRYYLFIAQFPNWLTNRPSQVPIIAEHFEAFNRAVEQNLRSRLAIRVLKTVRRHIAPYLVVRPILALPGARELLARPAEFASRVSAVCLQQYQDAHQRLHSGIRRSIIFIFLTKTILALLIELPYDLISTGAVTLLPLGVNLLFPAFYMVLLGASIKVPGAKNTEELVKNAETIVYQTAERQLVYKFRDRARGSGLKLFFNSLYLLAFLVSFSLMLLGLRWLHFNIAEGAIFFVFFSTVSFFGFRLSRLAHELMVVDEQPDLVSAAADFLMTPFIKIGQWLSDSYSRINFMTFLLDFLIEMPFKTILAIFEQWSSFIREKKEDIL